MVISVQFKDSNKVFRGKTYDYILHKDEEPPKKNSIIRMMDKNYDWIAYGTRVKIVDVRENKFTDTDLLEVKYVNAALD